MIKFLEVPDISNLETFTFSLESWVNGYLKFWVTESGWGLVNDCCLLRMKLWLHFSPISLLTHLLKPMFSEPHKTSKENEMKQATKPVVLDISNSDYKICGKILGTGKLDNSRKSMFLSTPTYLVHVEYR